MPSGNDVALAISKSPPFQRDQVASNYIGLAVSWPVVFFYLTRLDEQRCSVTLAYGAELWGAKLEVKVDIADYPRLKTAVAPESLSPKESTLIHGWIEGTIEQCTAFQIGIRPTKLEFFN